jgi:hypothetical protein
MFGPRYFAARFFPPRYFGRGGTPGGEGGFFGHRYFPAYYFASRYFAPVEEATVTPPSVTTPRGIVAVLSVGRLINR